MRSRAIAAVFATAAAVMATAAQADEISFNYNLAPGASKNFNVPAANVPIQMMGTQTTVGCRGVGQATLLRVAPPSFLEWVGLDIASNLSSTAKVSEGFSSAAGTHIIFLDFCSDVDIQVASATAIKVVNNSGSGFTAKGTVTLLW